MDKRTPTAAGGKGFGHERPHCGAKDDWLTPPDLLRALGGSDSFDLDPCACFGQPWPTARRHFTIQNDGLAQDWHGRIWLNPPYGPAMKDWLARLAAHGNGIALVFARTETRGFIEAAWEKADGFLFLNGRLRFHHADGRRGEPSPAPSVLIAFGEFNSKVLLHSRLPGYYVPRAIRTGDNTGRACHFNGEHWRFWGPNE